MYKHIHLKEKSAESGGKTLKYQYSIVKAKKNKNLRLTWMMEKSYWKNMLNFAL